MSRRSEIQVGLTVLVALGLLIWGVTWLKDYKLHARTRVWHVSFPQTGGLGASDEVQVNGIKKGAVRSMTLAGNHVLVDLALASDVALTHDSRVIVRNVGLMGEKVIAVDLSTTGAAWTARDTIPGEYEKGIPEVMGDVALTISAVTDLTAQLTQLAGTADKHGDVTSTLANVRGTSEELRAMVAENRKALSLAMNDFAATARATRALTADREAQLGKTLDHVSSAAEKFDRLSGRLDSLEASLRSVTGKIDRGEGTVGQLVNDRKLYTDLSATIDSLRSLVSDIKKNPKRYLRVSVF
ncbi:MAG: MCE family protein [Candidatus Eisenbacteria bacterium]|uniref:MCE family protein n=1 Tax=Eiseniibacteriota bacterium TaxID=2212470 RepID=A0A9D6L546_UNCEI|nr:MCE family protein [Candidatus Eisenbacteria bacterium]